MNHDLESVDSLVTDIVGTANFISRVFFNRNSFLVTAGISLLVVVLIWAI